MSPIDPAELSALLDGELPPERQAEVRAAMETDPALRAEYERLSRLDAAWSAAAAQAAFRPQLGLLGCPSLRFIAQVVCGVLALVVVRFVPKFALGLPSDLLPAAVLLIVLGWLLFCSLRETDADSDALATNS